MKQFLSYFSTFLLMSVLSCEQQELSISSHIDSQTIRVKNSRLAFASSRELTDFVNAQKKLGFDRFKKSLNGHLEKEFTSLLPVFDRDDLEKVDNYRSFKIEQHRLLKERAIERFPTLKGRLEQLEEDVDFENDPLIADPFFAALLNRDREIMVGGKIYKYTQDGIFYADEDEYDALSGAINKYRSGSQTPFGGIVHHVPSREAPIDPCFDDCGGGTPAPPPPPPPPAPTKEEVKNSLRVCFWDANIWDDIFGPAEDCLDYFESDKRVKTKVWSQNYLIFASTGIKVESQNRFLRIWWADDIDEVELGYTTVYFEYDLPKPVWPTGYVYQYQYGDYIIDQYGRYVGTVGGGVKSLFEKFPIEDPSKRIVTIYLFEPLESIIGQSTLDLTGKDVNAGIQSLVKQAYSTLSNYLKKEINGPAVVVYPSAQNDKLKFLFTNWSNTNSNDNKIVETFDWNSAVIGFSTKGPSTSPVYDSPQSYKKFSTVAYGMGRRGTTWKGSRVVLNDD